MKWLVGLACLALGGAGLVLTSSRISGDECFRYDLGVPDAVICGSPEHIADELKAQAKAMVESADGLLNDPVNLCKLRAVVQRDMHRWPDFYYQAYLSGCVAADVRQAKSDANYGPAWQKKRDIKEGVMK